jgi:high frequency lysogenization protein
LSAPNREETLALAAVFQALSGVNAFAENGQEDKRRTLPLLEGLVGEYTGSVATLYGGEQALDTGLRVLIEHLSQPTSMQLTRYLVAVMQLERRLRRNRRRLNALADDLKQARERVTYFGQVNHDNVIYNLADIYARHISAHRPKILVQGQAQYLQDERIAAHIRALLLAAIRAAGLWQANGGGRLGLVMGRRAVINAAEIARHEI